MAKTLNVLFIGNSFTARNDLPGLVAKLAAAKGKELRHRLISAGGASLRAHWNAGEAAKAIQTGGYDFVVLQEQSTLPVKNATRMHENVRLFDEAITSAGAKTVLYMTWAHRAGERHPDRIVVRHRALVGHRGSATLHGSDQVRERLANLRREEELQSTAEVRRRSADEKHLRIRREFVPVLGFPQEPRDDEVIRQDSDASRRRIARSGNLVRRAPAVRDVREQVEFDRGLERLRALIGVCRLENDCGRWSLRVHCPAPVMLLGRIKREGARQLAAVTYFFMRRNESITMD